MTNELSAAGVSVGTRICTEFENRFGHQPDVVQQAVNWLADKGVTLAFDLLGALAILLLGWLATRLIVSAVGTAVSKGRQKDTLLANFVRNATSKVCWSVLLVLVLGQLGVNVAPIVAGLGVTGFILGFAFQESLGNLASGLMIAVNEPFKIGDYVIVAGHEGSVRKVDMMATVLATGDNKKVIIPNKSAWGSPIVNFSALGRRRVDLKIGIDYGCDVGKAIRIALETLPTVPGVLSNPAPAVFVASLDDSQVTLNIRPWTEGATYWAVYNDTLMAIKAAFERNGIDIPFPQLTVHSV